MRISSLLSLAVFLLACGRVGAQHQAEGKSDVITKMVEDRAITKNLFEQD